MSTKKVFARLRTELYDDVKKYKIYFEIVETDGTVSKSYMVPGAAIIDTFKQILTASGDGYLDMLSDLKPIKLDDSDTVDNR